MDSRHLVASVGAAPPADLVLDLGDTHPTQQSPFQLALTVTDDVIVTATPRVGFMHRSDEKVLEVRDYRQDLLLADRHDWVAPFAAEIAAALAIESAMGLVPPERATWARTLLLELTRVAVGLRFTGAAVPDPIAAGLDRGFVDLQESLTGNRVHPMFTRIGGLAAPLPAAWLQQAEAWLHEVGVALPAIADRSAERWAPLAGVAALAADRALDLGVTGPVLRSAGIGLDLRRDAPTLAYPELGHLLTPATGVGCDVPGRYTRLLAEAEGAVGIALSCVARLRELGEGPFDVRLPKVVRVPESTSYADLEGPLGVTGVLVVGEGDKVPARLKLRTPGFALMQAMAAALPGVRLGQLADAVKSFFVVASSVDR